MGGRTHPALCAAGSAEADLDTGAEAIEAALSEMDEADVKAFAAEMMAWQDAQCEGERPALADTLENIGHKAATVHWHRPGAVHLSISFAQ